MAVHPALLALAAAAASGTAILAGAPSGAPAGPGPVPRAAPAPAVAAGGYETVPAVPAVPGVAAGAGASDSRSAGGSDSGPAGGPAAASGSTSGGASDSASAGASAGASPSMSPPPAGASPFASGAAWGAVNCATVPIRLGGGGPPTDVGGPLVPFGATTVTRCETPLASSRPGLRSSRAATAVRPPKVLGAGTERFAAVLNSLPSVAADQACLPITLPIQLSLVFTYPQQPPLTVVVDPTCSALIAGDRARSYAMLNPLPLFDTLYAAQPTPMPT